MSVTIEKRLTYTLTLFPSNTIGFTSLLFDKSVEIIVYDTSSRVING